MLSQVSRTIVVMLSAIFIVATATIRVPDSMACQGSPSSKEVDAWADSVVYSNVLGNNNKFKDPTRALGPQDYNHSSQSGFVSLGGGELIIDFGVGEEAIDGTGPDLRVYNPGTGSGESFDVLASNVYPTDDWTLVGSFTGNGVARIDIEPFGLIKVRFVRIVDTTTTGLSGSSPGVDIDYISAVHFLGSPYANNVVMHTTTGNNNEHIDPVDALGPPDYLDSPQSGYISLGHQGELILDMGLGEEITDGPGYDLRILNPGSDGGEIANVYVSNSSNGEWKFIGKLLGSLRINDFDISLTGFRYGRYIRIADASTGDLTDENPATDIDYVEALYLPDSVTLISFPVVIRP